MRFEVLLLILILTMGIGSCAELSVITIPQHPNVGKFVVRIVVTSQTPIENANLMVSGIVDGSYSLGDFVGSSVIDIPVEVHAPGVYDVRAFLSYVENGSYEHLESRYAIIVSDHPKFELLGAEGYVRPGESGVLRLIVKNAGGLARNVFLRLHGFHGGMKYYRIWKGGESKTVDFEVYANSSTPVGTYTIPLEVSCLDEFGTPIRTTIPVRLRVVGSPKLVISSVNFPKLSPDMNFTLTIGVENVGKDDARDVRLNLTLPDGFSGERSAYIGDLKRNEQKFARFHLRVGNVSGDFKIGVEMRSEKGVWNDTISIYVFPLEEMRVDIAGVYTIPQKLVAGKEFKLNVELENSGRVDLKGVMIELELPKGFVGRDTYFIGSLKSGDSATSTFYIRAGKEGRYVVRARIRYLDPTLKEHVEYENFTLYVFPAQNNVPIVALVLLILVGVGFWLWRRS